MGNYDVKIRAYEAIKNDPAWQKLTKAEREQQFGRYALGLQNEESKLANKIAGKQFAKELATERKQANLFASTAAEKGITFPYGSGVEFKPISEYWTEKKVFTVEEKTKVGKGSLAKYYLKDAQGNVYQVDKAAYKAATKGKTIPLAENAAKPVDVASIPRQARNNLRVTGNATQAAGNATQATGNRYAGSVHGNGVEFKDLSREWAKHPGSGINYDPTTNSRADQAMTHQRFVEKWGWDPHKGGKPGTGKITPPETNVIVDPPIPAPPKPPINDPSRLLPEHIDDVVPPAPPVNPPVKPGTTVNNYNTFVNINQVDNRKLNQVADDLTKLNGKVDSLTGKVDTIGQKVGQLTGKVDSLTTKVDDIGQNVGKLSDKVDDLTKLVKSNNKRVALVAGAAALTGAAIGGLIGWAISKKDDAKTAESADGANQEATPVVPEEQKPNNNHDGKFGFKIEPPKIEVPEFKIPKFDPNDKGGADGADDADGADKSEEKTEHVTVKGDSFWKIAEKNLEAKFAKDPDKFANLTKEEKNRLIYKETIRIMELNGYKLDENKWFSEPMLHPNVKIKLTEKVDVAA